ncbi:GNAT family N-acetyltransferase [Allosphingosinicella deserti]|uniref:GNAT family N-acetyltransferase n=1 Tax=Allosphingosinicella deserti TaxID=2116704 RepID=A0A2P7QZ76_9SPHN|nr:GNAT family protein [Sphingomonas deserti]PSJ43271.1 GNAT family N-acetyltransferase [Sphingomonas deserti]
MTLGLIPFAPEHFAVLAGWFATEAELVSWGGPFLEHPLRRDQMQAMIDEGAGTPPGRLCWMGVHADRPVGHVQLAFDWRNGSARLARVAIAPDARGQGLAVPMVRQVVDRAFAHHEVERLELNVYAWNRAAIRTYRRLGFVTEGVRRSSTRVGSERWDTAIMAVLRGEWRSPGPDTSVAKPANVQPVAQGS